MTSTRLTLSIAAGIVLGGFCLCGFFGLMIRRPMRMEENQARRTTTTFGERDVLKSAVKIIGLSAIMYSSDNDDLMPPKADFKAKVSPYLFRRNQSERYHAQLEEWLSRFEVAFPGGNYIEAGKPEEIPMGWITAPDGYAVVYLDGSAEWRRKTMDASLPGNPYERPTGQ